MIPPVREHPEPAREKTQRPTVEVVTLVRVGYLWGAGVEGDPYRHITAYYDLQGQPVFEVDPWQLSRDIANRALAHLPRKSA